MLNMLNVPYSVATLCGYSVVVSEQGADYGNTSGSSLIFLSGTHVLESSHSLACHRCTLSYKYLSKSDALMSPLAGIVCSPIPFCEHHHRKLIKPLKAQLQQLLAALGFSVGSTEQKYHSATKKLLLRLPSYLQLSRSLCCEQKMLHLLWCVPWGVLCWAEQGAGGGWLVGCNARLKHWHVPVGPNSQESAWAGASRNIWQEPELACSWG